MGTRALLHVGMAGYGLICYVFSGGGNRLCGSGEGPLRALPQSEGSNIALWIAVLLAAGTALTGTAVYSRKRKYSK